MPTIREYFTAIVNSNVRSKTVDDKMTPTQEADTFEAAADYTDAVGTTKASLASPTFTGTPTAPTATTGTNTTQIATTAFVQQEIAASSSATKTSGAISQSSATPVALTNDINSLSYNGGVSYLPTTTEIGKEVICIQGVGTSQVQANVANTTKLFSTYGTFVSNVSMTVNQLWRFTYIGFGSGTGGATDGYWKAELMN